MPRGTRRSPLYRPGGSGGGGGGLGGFIAGLAGGGATGLEGGEVLLPEEMYAMGGQEALLAPEAAIEPLSVKKPGGFRNFLTGGAANQEYAELNNFLKLQGQENRLQQELLRRRLLGQRQLEELRGLNDLGLENTRFANDTALQGTKFSNEKTLAEKQAEAALNLAKSKAAFDFGVPQFEQFNAIGSSPDYLTELARSKFSAFDKSRLDNEKLKAETEGIRLANPTKAFMGVGNNAMVDPATGRAYLNAEPREFPPAPGYEGGLKEVNMNNFLKVPGGLDGQEKVFRGVPELLKRPVETTSDGMLQHSFIAPQPKVAVPQVPLTPPSITNPVFDTKKFLKDFPIDKIPLIEDWLKRRGMFKSQQSY